MKTKAEVLAELKKTGASLFQLASFDLPVGSGYIATLPKESEERYSLGAAFEREGKKWQLLLLHAECKNDSENFGMQLIPTTDKKVLELAPKTKIPFTVTDFVSKTTGRAGKAVSFDWRKIIK